MSSLDPDSRPLILEAGRADQQYWIDLWRYRELFFILAWRDVAVRYKQTVIWALLRPLLTMVVFTVIFGQITKLPLVGTAPYPLMVFAGMLPWTFFSAGLSEGSSSSLVANANLISKVYFPRLIVPTATIVVAFADFLVTFSILAGMIVWYRPALGWQLAGVACVCPARILCQHGPSVMAHLTNVGYRDFRIIVVPFIVQFGLYVSPVGFSSVSYRRHGGSSIRSIPWSGSSTGFADVSLAGKASFTCRASWRASPSQRSFCGSASAASVVLNQPLRI